MLFKSLLIVAILATSAFAVPTGHRSSCSVNCAANDRFFYEIGKTYEYQYTAETRTGTSEHYHEVDETDPGIKVQATVQIHPISLCEYVLTLKDVTTDASSSSRKFSTEVTKRSLRFSLQNGRIESICPSTNEPIWVLNFKKGILSTFQNTMNTDLQTEVVTETDVSGICKTVYNKEGLHGGDIITKKTKSPAECTKKPQTSSQLESFGFNLDSVVEGMIPITSEQSCTHTISENIVKNVYCNEVHTFKPFSHQTSGRVFTAATTSLNMVRVVSGAPKFSDTFDFKTELTYDHTELEELQDLISAEEVLSKLEDASRNGIQKEVPQLFSELVSYMKRLSKSQLSELLTVAGDKHAIKFVFDAMPLVGTSASNEYIVDLIREGKYSEDDTALYYASLAFIKNPSEDIFVPLVKLLEHEEQLHDKAMLGISSLIHNYCQSNEDCGSVYVIEQLIRHFESYLGVSCRSTDEETKNTILIALKSLGNVGRWINADSILRRCFMETNPTEVRLAAIEAWRRSPCSYNRNHLLSTYEDSSYDSEIRIAAYLQVMKCPTKVIVDTIKDRLTSEGVNHVSSFVWSHLNNIQESAAQDKQWIRELIGEQFLQEKFTTEMLKFSRYFESSMYSKELNVGGSIDSDVIFSTESFIPRSAMLNLTVNLFGQSVNLFEIGGRIEGYEHFIEKFFGPNGYYPDETIAQVIKNMRDEKFNKSPELEKLIGHSNTDPKGSLFVRLLGNELFYTSHLGSKDILSQFGFKSPMDLITEMFTKRSINIMKSFNLVKSKFTVPTITGFPLKVSFDGTATVGFVLDGDFKVDKLNSFELQGKLKPSAAVNIDSSMIVDAFVTKSGRKFTTTLHSSTVAEGKAIVKGLKLVDFSLHIPEKDMTVYEFSHDTIRINNGEEHKEFVDSDMGRECYPNEGVLGIQLCNHVQTARNGDVLSRNLIVKKMDTHTSYDFHFVRDDDKFSVMLDMPNSKESYRHKLSYYFDGKNYEAKFHCPHVHKTVKGIVDVMLRDKTISFHLLDGPKEYEQFATKLVIENFTGYVVKPSIMFSIGGQEVSHIEGEITNDDARKVLQIQAISRLSNSHHASAMFVPSGELAFTWKYGENSRDVALKFSSFRTMSPNENYITIELNGSGKVNEDHIALMLDGYYQKYDNKKTEIRVITDLKKEISSDGSVYKLSADIPYFNIKTRNELSLVKNNYGLMSEVEMQQSHWKFNTYYITKDNENEKFVTAKLWLDSFHKDTSYGVEKTIHMKKDGFEGLTNVACGININSKLTYKYGQELRYILDIPGLYTVNFEIGNKGSGKLSLESSLKSMYANGVIKGIFENQSTNNVVDWKLNSDVTYTSLGGYSSTYKVQSHLDTDGSTFNFDFGVNKMMKRSLFLMLYEMNNLIQISAKTTPSSIYFTSNVLQPFKLDAKFSTQENTNYMQGVAHYGENVVEFMGEYSPKKIIGTFKANDKMMKFSGVLTTNGLETFLMWSPDQKIDILVKYDNSDSTSVLLSVQTPFQQWRKQEIGVRYKFNKHQLDSSVNIIWRNTEHLNFNGKLDWDMKSLSNNEVSGIMSFTSTIPKFERIQFNIKHKAFDSNDGLAKIQTHFKGEVGYQHFSGKFILNSDIMSSKSNLEFISPFTKPFNMEITKNKSPTAKSYSLFYVYGSKKSLFNLNLENTRYPYKFVFKADSPHLPLIEWTMQYDLVNRKSMITTRSLLNNKEVLYVKLEDISDRMNVAYKATGRLSHPITGMPLTFNSLLMSDDDIIEFDFDMSPIKGRQNEKIKLHTKTNILNATPYNIYIVGHYSGYGSKGSVTINHKIDMTSHKMNSEIYLNIDSFNLNTFVEAFVDPRQLSGSLTTTIKSSLESINGVVFTAKHEVEDNARNTLIRYKKGDFTSKVYNSISFYDAFNWNNVLIADNFLKTTNKMSLSKDHHLISELEWNIGAHKLFSKFDKYPSGEFDTKTSINTPYMPQIQFQATHEFVGEKGIFKGKILYGDEKITTETEYLILDNFIHLKHETLSKYYSWTPFEIELDINTKTEGEVKMSAVAGNKFGMSFTLFDKRDVYGGKLSYENKKTGQEMSFEGKHFFSDKEGQIYMEGNYDEKLYVANIEYTNHQDEINVSAEFKLPSIMSETIKTTMYYNFGKNYFNVNVINGLEVYEVVGKLEDKSMMAEITNPSGKLNIASEWSLKSNNGEISIRLNGNGHNSNIGFKYNKGHNPEGTFYAIYNGKEYHLNGIVENNSISFIFTTPENIYKMKASLNISDQTEFEIVLLRNSDEVRITGKGRCEIDQGSLQISISTPFNNEENFVKVLYRLSETTELKLEGKFASKHIFIHLIQEPAPYAKGFKTVLDIKLPIQNYEEISIVNINEHKQGTNKGKVTIYVMEREIAFAKLKANSNKLEFSLGHTNIKVEGMVQFTNGIDFFVNFDDGKLPFNMAFNYDKVRNNFNGYLHNGDFAAQISGSGKISSVVSDISISFKTFMGEREVSRYEGHFAFELSDQIMLKSVLNYNGEEYYCKYSSSLSSGNGFIKINVQAPFKLLGKFRIDGLYNIHGHVKMGKLATTFNGIEEIFSAELENMDKKFSFKLDTPFKMLSNLTVEGEYDHTESFYRIKGQFNNDDSLLVEGQVIPTISGYQISAVIPTNYGRNIINGEITKKSLSFINVNPFGKEQFITAKYQLENSQINLQVQSSYPEFRNFAVESHFHHSERETSIILKIQKDSYDFKVNIKTKLQPNDYYVKLLMESADDEYYKFEWGLNTQSLEKSLYLILDSKDLHHFFEGQVSFLNNDRNFIGMIKAKSSLVHLYNFHVETNCKLEENELNNKFRFAYNDYDYSLTFHAVGKENIYQVNTVIEDSVDSCHLLSFDLLLDAELSKAYSRMVVAEKIFKMQVEFMNKIKNQKIEVNINTPYKEYEHLYLNVQYDLTENKNIVKVKINHNTPIIELIAVLSTDIKTPEIHLKFNSRFTDHVEVRASFNTEDTIDLINLRLKLSDRNDYAFGVGYAFNMQRVAVSMKLKSPQHVFGKTFDFDFTTDFKFEENRNSLALYFEKDGEVYIDIDGAYFDDETKISFHTENDILGNFKTHGSYDRKKRSIQWKMMNDHHSGEISANFHSLKINLQTPYKRIQKWSLSLVKDNNGKWIMNYKRNENYIDYEIGRTKRGIETKLNAAIPSWELLAITGRLTEAELEGYLTGKLPESKLTITGKGVLGRKKGEIKWEINAPDFPTLKRVNAKFDYNVRKGTYTYSAKSSTNKDFKIFLEFKRGGLFIDVFIPHSETPTIAKGQLTIFKGKLNITSRFPAIKTYNLEYSIEIRKSVDIKYKIERNGVQVFNLEFHKGPDKYHFLVEIRREGIYSKFHYHRMGWDHLDMVIHRNGLELSANLKGSGNLPTKGEIAFIIKNSFRLVPREVTGTINIDRTGSPKIIVLTVEKSPSKFYIATAKYNIDLKDMKKGDFNLRIDTPTKIGKPWKNINLEWEFDSTKTGYIKMNCGHKEVTFTGKISFKESDFVVSTNQRGIENRVYGWKFEKRGDYRDYMIKFGPEKSYTHLAISGTMRDIRNADIKGTIKSRHADHPLLYTLKWSGNKDIGISGDGSFECGEKKGVFKLHYLKRDPVKRAARFKWTGTSNIKNWSSYSIVGEYDISAGLIDVNIKWDNDKLSLYTKINNFTAKKSQNTATLNIPGVGPSEINFGHDFTNPLAKTVKIDGHFGGKDFHYIEKWTRNAEFTVLNLDVNIKSNFIGVIKMTADYDVRDIDNAKGHIVYTRDGKNNLKVDWHRTKTDNSIVNEVVIDSKSKLVPSSKAYFKADWERDKLFASSIGVEWNNKEMKAVLSIDQKMAKFYTKTPFPNINDITAILKYDLQKKVKTITLNYDRGQRKLNFSFVLNYKSKKQGSIDISLTTPFAIIKKVMFNAKWNKGKFDAHYQRNDKKIDIDGKADIKQGKSSYDFVFTPKSGNPVHIKFNYDLVDFFKRTSKMEQEIISLDIDAGEHNLSVHVSGYSSKEKLILCTEGTSSLKLLKTFRIKIDSELNLANREGLLDIKINDFEYKMKNSFQKLENGFYFRTQIHSTITRLPGLTLGYGKDGKTRTVTIGHGDEREISISLNGKDEYKKGLYGKIDIPRKGIMGIEYDITYDFIGDDKFNLKTTLKLKNNKKISYELDYHSDGVRTRLAGPLANLRRLRAKRSIDEDFEMENYAVTFKSGNNVIDKGIMIEGQIMGKPFSVDTYLNLQDVTNSQGKLLIKTPFEGYRKLGGYFTIQKEGQKLTGTGDVFFHGHASAEFEANSNDINDKNVTGTVTYAPINEEIELSVNLIANIKKDQSIINIRSKHASSQGDNNIVIKISPRNDGHYISAAYNDYVFDAEYVLRSSPVYFKLYSEIISDNTVIHKSEVETSLKKQEFLFSTDISINQISHNLKANIEISENLHNIEVNYEQLNGCNMKLGYKNSYNRKQFSFICRGSKLHLINFDLHDTNNYNLILEINSENFPKVYLSSVIGDIFKTEVEIATSFGVIGTDIEAWAQPDGILFKTKTKYISDSSSFIITMKVMDSLHGHEIFGKFTHNTDEHLFHGKYEVAHRDVKVYLEVGSPIFSMENSFIDFRASCINSFKVSMKTFIFNVLHQADIEADKKPKTISINIISPIVPTGQCKVQLHLEGESIAKSKIEVLVSNAKSSYFGKVMSKLESDDGKEIEVYLRTPIEGFEEIRFGGGYKAGSMKEAYIYAHPFNFKAGIFMGNELNKYKVGFEVVPGTENLHPVAAEAVIPLNKISPHFSVRYGRTQYDVDFVFNNTDRETEVEAIFTHNGQRNGGQIYYTKNFPVELGYKIVSKSEPVAKFHVMVDSSIFTFSNVAYLLL